MPAGHIFVISLYDGICSALCGWSLREEITYLPTNVPPYSGTGGSSTCSLSVALKHRPRFEIDLDLLHTR